ncbi:MAG: hypothetical protein U0694_17980 [Anaerolineae bacterium]
MHRQAFIIRWFLYLVAACFAASTAAVTVGHVGLMPYAGELRYIAGGSYSQPDTPLALYTLDVARTLTVRMIPPTYNRALLPQVVARPDPQTDIHLHPRLALPERADLARWSPNETHVALVFTTNEVTALGYKEYAAVLNPADSSVRRVTPDFLRVDNLRWSSVSDTLLIVEMTGRGSEVYTLEMNQPEPRLLTGDGFPYQVYAAGWHPDGVHIVMEANYTTTYGVIVMDSRSAEITLALSAASVLEWSPDGTQLAYNPQPTRRVQDTLCFVAIDGSGQRCLRLPAPLFVSLGWLP